MLVVTVDGPAHSGKSDFASAILRLTGYAGGYISESTHVAYAEAATEAVGGREARKADMEAWVQTYLDPGLRRSVYDKMVSDFAAFLFPLIVIENSGVDRGRRFDGVPRSWMKLSYRRRIERASLLYSSPEVENYAAHLADWLQYDPSSNPNEPVQMMMGYLIARDIKEVGIEDMGITATGEPNLDGIPAPEGWFQQEWPTSQTQFERVLIEDLLAVSWLRHHQDILDAHNVPHVDLSQIPAFDEANPLTDIDAASAAAKALNSEVEKVSEATRHMHSRAADTTNP